MEDGIDIIRIQDLGIRGVDNQEVVKLANQHERVILTRDSDFTASSILSHIMKILRDGVRIVDRGANAYEVIPISSEIVEVQELESAAASKWLRRDPIDMDLLREIEARINEGIRDLEELLEMGRDRVLADKHLRKSFERTLQTLIEGMMDMLRHVVSGLNLGVATYYRDYVDIARDGGVISGETAGSLRRLIPLRHILVHRYRGLRYDELWREAGASMKTARKIVEEVKQYLRSREQGI